MKVLRPKDGVIHLVYNSQDELCRAMQRIQEFYESPYEEIRGKYFTVEQYNERYAKDHDTSYYEDWNGFNVPGHVLGEFFTLYDDLSLAELEIENLENWGPNNYLIATWVNLETDDDVLDHELAHATWYLNPEYRERAQKLVDAYKILFEGQSLVSWLLKRGYDASTMDDEINAYLATDYDGIYGEAAKPFWKLYEEYVNV